MCYVSSLHNTNDTSHDNITLMDNDNRAIYIQPTPQELAVIRKQYKLRKVREIKKLLQGGVK